MTQSKVCHSKYVNNMGPILIENNDDMPLPCKFKYIEQNYIRPNIRKQFRSKHLLLSCVCQYRYIYVEKANGQNVEEACNDECLNRQIYIECVNCEWDKYCTNKNFTNGCLYTLKLFSAGLKGWGVKTLDFIKKGSFVLEYLGEIITQDEFNTRSIKYESDKNKHFYTMALCNNFVIDATIKGNIARFINHSCDPNLITQLWSVNGYHRMGFFALYDIHPNTELSFDYNFIRFNSEPQKCYCGSKNCTGEIGKSIIFNYNDPVLFNGDEENIIDTKKIDIPISSNITLTTTNLNTENIDHNNNDSHQMLATSIRNMVSNNEDGVWNKILNFVKNDTNLDDDSCIQKFVHLMLRCTSIRHKMELMNYLFDNKTDKCLFEFIRMKILVIMWSWTFDDDSLDLYRNTEATLTFRDKLLDVLHLFTIPYRNVIDECKLEKKLEDWKNEIDTYNKDKTLNCVNEKCDLVMNKIILILEKWNRLENKYKIPKKKEIDSKSSTTLSYNPEGLRNIRKRDDKSLPSNWMTNDRKHKFNSSHMCSIGRFQNSPIIINSNNDNLQKKIDKIIPSIFDVVPTVSKEFLASTIAHSIFNVTYGKSIANNFTNHNTSLKKHHLKNSPMETTESSMSESICNSIDKNSNNQTIHTTTTVTNNYNIDVDNNYKLFNNKTSDEIYTEKFNRNYHIPNWDSSDENNKIFKNKLAQFIVEQLKPYYQVVTDNCRTNTNEIIKINSKMEFKYLAKKITHMVIVKELRVLSTNAMSITTILAMNNNLEQRVRIFIKEFMSIYKKT